MENVILKVENVSKIYKLYDNQSYRVKEALSIKKKIYHRKFSALNNVSFQISQGEMIGIIGKNGSGKSTILKIITGVLTPTTGTVETHGKISALLELGAGFNMEYTGLENIYLSGRMIGFLKEEMDEKLQDIISFADIGDFINQPVKMYSSGMFARLAFAVAINVEPDILIVDEALSVGDVFFQAKCYKKLEELKNGGKTILFVTHDMGSIMKYCNRVIVLNEGVKVAEGPAKEMIDIYKKILVGQHNVESDIADDRNVESEDQLIGNQSWKDFMLLNENKLDYGNGNATIIDFGLFDENGKITNTIYKMNDFTIKMKVKFNVTIENPIFAFSIKDIKGTELTGTNTIIEKIDTGICQQGEIVEISFKQKMILQGGQHLLQLGCTGFNNDNLIVYHRLYDVCCIQVISDKTTVGYCDMDSKVKLVRGR